MPRDYGVCRLCHRERNLQRSHLIPRAYYKLLRTPDADDPNPITTFDHITRSSQDQVWQHLLCEACEDRINKNGERWVLLNNYRLDGPSPMYRALFGAQADPKFPSGTVYSARQIPQIDIDKLVYFGASVFWRASVAEWTMGGKKVRLIHLGSRYEEQFRQYLNGESGFPDNAAIWVAVVRSESPPPLINFPVGESVGKYHRHSFNVLGLDYFLYVGGNLPEEITRHCAARTPERYMFFTDIESIIERKAVEVFNKATPTKKLRERAAKDGVRL